MDNDMKDLFGSESEEGEQEVAAAHPAQAPAAAAAAKASTPAALAAAVAAAAAAPTHIDHQLLQAQARELEDEDEDGEDGFEAGGRRQQPHQPQVAPPLEVEAPLLPLPPADSVSLMRPTNIVSLQPSCFDAATHQLEESTFIDAATGARRLRLSDTAVIRWRTRVLPDGREVRESNARFVRWEDGSLQLFLGNEVLDVAEQDNSKNNNYLFAHAKGIIQGQMQLSTKLALRPATLESGLHRRLRDEIDKRHGKMFRVARHGGMSNPEAGKLKVEAKEDDRIKAAELLAKKREKVMGKANGKRSKAADMDDEAGSDEEGGDSGQEEGMTAAERARHSLSRNRALGDADAEAAAAKRLQDAKRGPVKRKEEPESEDEDEEEEEGVEAAAAPPLRARSRRGRAVSSDAGDEEGGGGGGLEEGGSEEEPEFEGSDEASSSGSEDGSGDEGGSGSGSGQEEVKDEGGREGKREGGVQAKRGKVERAGGEEEAPQKKKRRMIMEDSEDD